LILIKLKKKMQYLVSPETQFPKENSDLADKRLQIFNDIQNIINGLSLLSVDSDKSNDNQAKDESAAQKKVSFPGISELMPHLYLCGAGVAMPNVLDQLGVNFVISAAPELPDTPLSSATKPLYLRVPVLDRPDQDLSIYFDEVADMIEGVRLDGGKTLVHCVAGVSRSASLCLAYLMKHQQMTLREAFEHVKRIRPQIRPNSAFFEQLRKYDEKLFGKSSVQMIYYASLDKEIPDVFEAEYKAMEEYYQRKRKEFKKII